EQRHDTTPVLLLHGVLTWSFIFDPILPGLTARYRVLVPDLLGCGDSDKPLADLHITSQAGRILQILDHCGLERVHLVAHDVGGGIAQLLALDAPDRLSSLTLINPIGYDYWPVPAIEVLRTPFIRQAAVATFDFGTLKAMVRHGLGQPERLDAAVFEQFQAPLRDRAGRQSFLAMLGDLDTTDLTSRTPDLARITTPTLLVRGDKDHYLAPEITLRLARDIPSARLEMLPDAGHFAMLDAPDALGALIRSHLDGCEDAQQNSAAADRP
ncbi:MAG: alpha/beta hydrolase, partial [Oligoflexia bacterium]|nr:alpha/beta hydrolase [Oligoflexia bacterium]